MPTKTLYIMIGVPGSGKSTWINETIADAKIISPDAYLEERYNYEWTPVRAAQAWSHCYQAFGRAIVEEMLNESPSPVEYVWDATNLTPRDRSAVVGIAKGAGWQVVAVYFDTPFAECERRNNLRPRHRRVPDKSMRDMNLRLTPPADDEGWDDCIYVKWEG
jgi:predicted kinase